MISPSDPRIQQCGFAKLQGDGVEYYFHKYEAWLGRNSKSTQLDVVLGDNMNISRKHAGIVYNFDKGVFELVVLGKNGVTVSGTLYTPSSPPLALRSRDLIQMGDRSFYFLLPRGASVPAYTTAPSPATQPRLSPAQHAQHLQAPALQAQLGPQRLYTPPQPPGYQPQPKLQQPSFPPHHQQQPQHAQQANQPQQPHALSQPYHSGSAAQAAFPVPRASAQQSLPSAQQPTGGWPASNTQAGARMNSAAQQPQSGGQAYQLAGNGSNAAASQPNKYAPMRQQASQVQHQMQQMPQNEGVQASGKSAVQESHAGRAQQQQPVQGPFGAASAGQAPMHAPQQLLTDQVQHVQQHAPQQQYISQQAAARWQPQAQHASQAQQAQQPVQQEGGSGPAPSAMEPDDTL